MNLKNKSTDTLVKKQADMERTGRTDTNKFKHLVGMLRKRGVAV